MRTRQILSAMCLTIVAMGASGCATMQTIDMDSRSRVMDADYATTMNAAIDYLNSDAWLINSVDKDLGLINTEFKSISGWSSLLNGEERYKLNFFFRPQSPTQTRVTANMLYEGKTGFNFFRDGEWTQANMTERDAREKYCEILNGVQAKIAR